MILNIEIISFTIKPFINLRVYTLYFFGVKNLLSLNNLYLCTTKNECGYNPNNSLTKFDYED
jgi:hypothetical protein